MAALSSDTRDRVESIISPQQADIEATRKWLGLTQEELAQVVGRSRRTIARWRRGAADQTHARGETARTVRKLNRLQFVLEDLMPREEALRWLRAPNPYYRGGAPIDLLLGARLDDLLADLETLADGGDY